MEPPQSGDRLAVHDLEDAPVSVQPLDVVRTVGGGLEEGEEELPQVGVVVTLGSPGSGQPRPRPRPGPVRGRGGVVRLRAEAGELPGGEEELRLGGQHGGHGEARGRGHLGGGEGGREGGGLQAGGTSPVQAVAWVRGVAVCGRGQL